MKNVFKKLLYIIIGCAVLLCLLILLCAVSPGLSGRLSDRLYSAGEAERTEEGPARDGAGARPAQPSAESGTVETMPEPAPEEEQALEGISDRSKTGEEFGGYIPPEEERVEAPAEVAGRTGFKPVEGTVEQLAEEPAETADYGETGDGLSFDAQMYPYYAMLDESLKRVYGQIYANAVSLRDVFAPVERVTPGQLKSAFTAVLNDHPELFWLESGYSCQYIRGGGCAQMKLSFNRTARDLDAAKEEFNAAASEILSGAEGLDGDFEKELYVHDALNGRVDYRLSAPDNQSAYSALAGGETVCAGYARAYQYLLQQLGIPCYYCTGYAGQNHAWNLVRLDDGFYNVDTTWDDTEPSTYDYFNRTDEEFSTTHVRKDLSVYLPACGGQAYRELAQNPDTRRGLLETGLTEDDVRRSMEEYYADCYDKTVWEPDGLPRSVPPGGLTVTFESVLEGKELWQQWQDGYNREAYADGYLRQALEELGGSSCRLGVEVEELKEDRYLLRHTLNIK